ncbi:hypothetical protein MANES_01G053150v8 [Manihot esculenta]|uniref:Uncharacterized protein n=1 Tax=Manihot esculenta TaxID=3983 RepID=A0ACB7ICQ2_MANES|nr:hypothetical protein MANES_01G053150v8 [Manihot esculenta]
MPSNPSPTSENFLTIFQKKSRKPFFPRIFPLPSLPFYLLFFFDQFRVRYMLGFPLIVHVGRNSFQE